MRARGIISRVFNDQELAFKLNQILNTVGHEASAGLLFLGRRISPFCSSGEYLQGCRACLMQGHTTMRADRVFAETRSGSSRSIEYDENLTAFRSDLDAEARTATIPIDDLLG